MGDTDQAFEGGPLGSSSPELTVLTARERVVFSAIHSQSVTLAEAYRTILTLTRPGDHEPLAPILAMHLCRELVNSLPGVFGIPRAQSVRYDLVMDQLAVEWPKGQDGSRGQLPTTAPGLLAPLLDKHESVVKQRDRTARMIIGLDPAQRGHAGQAGVAQWEELRDRAIGVAHRLMNPKAPFPDPAYAQSVAGDLTDALFGLLGPYLATTAAIDELLKTPAPTLRDAESLAALMKTPSQEDHVFDHVPLGWFPLLAKVKDIFDPPPETLPAEEEGWVYEPSWPAARLLRRVAQSDPDGAAVALGPALSRRNRFVVDAVLDVLLAVPVATARKTLTSQAPAWPGRNQVSLMSAPKIADLGVRFINSGETTCGLRTLRSLLRALWADRENSDWLIEECLKRLLDALGSPTAAAFVEFFYKETARAVKESHYPLDLSEQWLPGFTSPPRYGLPDRPWRFLLALYTIALAQPEPEFRRLVDIALKEGYAPLRRLGVALLAARPDDAPAQVKSVLRDPSTWNKAAEREFAALLEVSFEGLDANTRTRIVAYARAAAPVAKWHARLVAEGAAGLRPLAEHQREWRSQFLSRVAAALTPAELALVGPLIPVASVEEPQELERLRLESPKTAAEINQMGVAGFVAFARTWIPSEHFGDTNSSMLGYELKLAVQTEPQLWLAGLDSLVGIGALYLSQVMLGFISVPKNDSPLPWDRILGWIGIALASAPDNADDRWRLETKRAIVTAIGTALDAAPDGLAPEALAAACRLLLPLLGDSDPTAGDDARDVRTGAAAFSSGMGSVRSQAAFMAARLLFASRNGPLCQGRETLDATLRSRTTTERSPAVWAGFGMGLPWLLTLDGPSWAAALFGKKVDEQLKEAASAGYIATWGPKTVVAEVVPQCYEIAISTAKAAPPADRSSLDLRPRIGQHLATLSVWGVPKTAAAWLDAFLVSAPEGVIATTVRHLADLLAVGDLPEDSRARALAILKGRLPKAGKKELRVIGWASRSSVDSRAVFVELVAPAVIAAKGTEDLTGVMTMLVALADVEPLLVGKVLGVLVEDPISALPHLAAAELRAVLVSLLARPEAEARASAEAVINTLAARGRGEYADLLRA